VDRKIIFEMISFMKGSIIIALANRTGSDLNHQSENYASK